MADTTHSREKVQMGGRVDKSVYEDFRQFVKKQHGSVRGNLGTELEKAMKDRMHAANGTTPIARIENDIATMKAIMADNQSDGGTPVPTASGGGGTHTHQDGKPAANSPRNRKITYLLDTVLDEYSLDRAGGELPKDDLRHTINDEYGFQEETVDEYEELIVRSLDAVEHPQHGVTWIWGDNLEQVRDKIDQEAAAELDDL